MAEHFSEERYKEMIDALFMRFPSFQKVGAGAYKPGVGNMEFIDQLLGHPHRAYKIIHVAGTNGKGSVSNMLTSVLASLGYKVGLYTSPHILDFRERIRVVSCHGETAGQAGSDGMCQAGSDCRHSRLRSGISTLIPKEDVWDFIQKWQNTFDHLDMSFFEITTAMALHWFAVQEVDFVVLETGLGGRLDSTNIVTPLLSVITNIGLDHCDLLGDTLPEIAFEKAGIIKPGVPVVIGESNAETDPVFERKVLYTNLPEPKFMGSRSMIMSLLSFADKTEPMLWDRHEDILAAMDLQGAYQEKNLRTVLAAVSTLLASVPELSEALAVSGMENVVSAIEHTAVRTGFRGRWEKMSDNPLMICDIGHNAHGLKYNFAQLQHMKSEGRCTDLVIVYGSVADKDFDSVLPLMPADAYYVFTQARSRRALPAADILARFIEAYPAGKACAVADVAAAVAMAKEIASDPAMCSNKPLVYIGGSTYVVSEAVECM